ncbi:MAG: MOSC domain-containing protein [Pseudomonadota bacterium]
MHQPLAPTMADLLTRFPRSGRVEWIGIRPERRQTVQAVETVEATKSGLDGDHRARPGKRAVTLIQQEHLSVIAALSGQGALDPALLRRNIVVSGISLLALKGQTVDVGKARFLITGPCAPCSRMEEYLGQGGYNAMRGHGGVTAEVVEAGQLKIGDAVKYVK